MEGIPLPATAEPGVDVVSDGGCMFGGREEEEPGPPMPTSTTVVGVGPPSLARGVRESAEGLRRGSPRRLLAVLRRRGGTEEDAKLEGLKQCERERKKRGRGKETPCDFLSNAPFADKSMYVRRKMLEMGNANFVSPLPPQLLLRHR